MMMAEKDSFHPNPIRKVRHHGGEWFAICAVCGTAVTHGRGYAGRCRTRKQAKDALVLHLRRTYNKLSKVGCPGSTPALVGE